MNRHEAKFQNTAVKMNRALIALMEKNSFEAITIKSLCEKAGVNRSTFYTHYQNMNELLDDTRCYILRLFTDAYARRNLQLPSSGPSQTQILEKWIFQDDFMIPYLNVFSENRHIFLIPDFHPSGYQFSKEYTQMFESIAVPLCHANGITDPVWIEYITQYYTSGTHAIIIQWLQRGCQESTEEVCRLIRRCVCGSKLLQPLRNSDTIEEQL